jgi:hypothetical protein
MTTPEKLNERKSKGKLARYIEYQKDTINIRLLIGLPFLVGLVVGLLWILVGNQRTGELPEISNSIMTNLVFFIWGFSGVVVMIKRELPGSFFSLRGFIALLVGIAWTVFFWGLAFTGFYQLITDILK